jgi:hypothetical protein
MPLMSFQLMRIFQLVILQLGFHWEFICRSEEVVAIAMILSTWGPSRETKIPLLNAIGVCPNAASGLCRCVIVLLEGVSSRNILYCTVSL